MLESRDRGSRSEAPRVSLSRSLYARAAERAWWRGHVPTNVLNHQHYYFYQFLEPGIKGSQSTNIGYGAPDYITEFRKEYVLLLPDEDSSAVVRDNSSLQIVSLEVRGIASNSADDDFATQ